MLKMMNNIQNRLPEMMSARQVDRLACKVLARVEVERVLWGKERYWQYRKQL